MERLIPKPTDQHISVCLPNEKLSTVDNLLQFGTSVLESVANGDLTPDQGKSITAIIVANCKIIETNQLAARVTEVEHILKQRKKELTK